jgi:histidinol-phosphate aminotransferase
VIYDTFAGWGNFVRADVARLSGFGASTSSGEPEPGRVIKLNCNENPYGCSPRVQQALAKFTPLNLYPDPAQVEIRRLLADYVGVSPDYVAVTAGGEQLIELIMLMLINSGDKIINCVPTFDVFRLKAQMHGGIMVDIPRDENFAVDVRAVKAAVDDRTKLICLATPNNPTGTLIPQEDILDIVANSGVPVLVDEAYGEFSQQTVVPLISQYPNMLILRTLSKWAGLAGLRIGYGVFAPEIVRHILNIKPIYGVNSISTVAVRESIADLDYLMGNVRAIIAERERLLTELGKLDFLKPFPSHANFVFCHVLKMSGHQLAQALRDRGILIGSFSVPGLENSVRITAGKPEDTDAVLEALRAIGDSL